MQYDHHTFHNLMLGKAEQSAATIKEHVGKDPMRLKFHFMPPAYWMNDPNGLIYYQGEYHMFYQFHPYSAEWGPMHWGHAKSKDLVHWEHLPIALAPSEVYDLDQKGGCFSGSAVDDNGILTLIYTGTIMKEGRVIQTQCLASSTDSVTFQKYVGNPVISVPPEGSSSDFRDPKVWKHEDKWYMVVGSSKDGKGRALLYRSNDLYVWEYVSVLAESDGTMGTMWECPDIFQLGDRYVLMFSPMGMGEKKASYLTGSLDYSSGKFTWDYCGEVDCGFEYYAPQSFLDDNGRRIIIGWLNAWDWMPWFKSFGPTKANYWCGAMSLPRTVELDTGGRLKFLPVEQLQTLRKEHYVVENVLVEEGRRPVPKEMNGDCLEIMVKFSLEDCDAEEFGLRLRCSEDGKETLISYDVNSKVLQFDRSRSDSFSEGVRTCTLETTANGLVALQIFVDTTCIEIYANEGRSVMSNNIYPDPASTGIDIFCRGGKVKMLSLNVWKLESIWR